jgi:hypothetical protein
MSYGTVKSASTNVTKFKTDAVVVGRKPHKTDCPLNHDFDTAA